MPESSLCSDGLLALHSPTLLSQNQFVLLDWKVHVLPRLHVCITHRTHLRPDSSYRTQAPSLAFPVRSSGCGHIPSAGRGSLPLFTLTIGTLKVPLHYT